MPQFDILRFPPQLFWLVVLFAIFVVLMYTVAVPTLKRTLDSRQNKLTADLDRAEQLKADIEAATAAYEKVLSEARQQAAKTLADAGHRIYTISSERQAASKQAIDAEIKTAETRIAAAKSAALGELRGIAIEATSAMADRLLGAHADESRIAGAVDAALATHNA